MKIVVLLAFSSFCMGASEFLVSGILTNLSQYFQISDARAGNLAAFYAIGVVIGAPIISVLISSWHYRRQLVFTLLVFCIAHITIFLSDNFIIVLIARFISGLMHGLFFVVATIVAIKVAPQHKTSTALSIMVSGLTIALVTGVPLGIFLSEHYGLLFPFAFIATITFLVAMSAFLIMPRLESKKGSFKNLAIAFKFPPLYQCFMVTAFTCGSQFVLYIYLRVFLEKHGFSPDSIKQIFLLYGIAAILGNFFGGKLTDTKGSFVALSIILVLQFFSFSCMSITHFIGEKSMIINTMFMAFFGFSMISPLKMLSTHLARTYTPATQNDTIAINEGSFNVGIALASFIGGMVEARIGINFNGLFGALFSLSAFCILVFFIRKAYYKTQS